jgi:hypothetical protein
LRRVQLSDVRSPANVRQVAVTDEIFVERLLHDKTQLVQLSFCCAITTNGVLRFFEVHPPVYTID